MLAFIFPLVGVTGGDHIVPLKKASQGGPCGVLSPNRDNTFAESLLLVFKAWRLSPGMSNLHPAVEDELLWKGEVIHLRASQETVDHLESRAWGGLAPEIRATHEISLPYRGGVPKPPLPIYFLSHPPLRMLAYLCAGLTTIILYSSLFLYFSILLTYSVEQNISCFQSHSFYQNQFGGE